MLVQTVERNHCLVSVIAVSLFIQFLMHIFIYFDSSLLFFLFYFLLLRAIFTFYTDFFFLIFYATFFDSLLNDNFLKLCINMSIFSNTQVYLKFSIVFFFFSSDRFFVSPFIHRFRIANVLQYPFFLVLCFIVCPVSANRLSNFFSALSCFFVLLAVFGSS